jgi:hypothetical protein
MYTEELFKEEAGRQYRVHVQPLQLLRLIDSANHKHRLVDRFPNLCIAVTADSESPFLLFSPLLYAPLCPTTLHLRLLISLI